MKVVGTSVQGVSHQKQEIACQDVCKYKELDSGELIIAVADGAGSAEYGAKGAACAVEEAINSLEYYLAEEEICSTEEECQKMMRHVFSAARQAVVVLAEKEERSERVYACTLTVVYVSRERLVTGQIGDGMVVVEDEEKQFASLMQPQQGEYINETYFLIGEKSLEKLDVVIHSVPVRSLVVMTDGLIRLAFHLENYEPSVKFFKPLIDYVARLEDEESGIKRLQTFLSSDRVSKRAHDDLTLVVASWLDEIVIDDEPADENVDDDSQSDEMDV